MSKKPEDDNAQADTPAPPPFEPDLELITYIEKSQGDPEAK